ncbi:3D domain-containing protein [Brevibacillus ginsengisoli]|uniref:3D domain-containing protein n=1 Tax=Brevibacillus ginsengisoli TaxID=363854 RepID=UPI003CEE20FB
MKWKLTISFVAVLLCSILFPTDGFSYNLIDSDVVHHTFGIKEEKIGSKIIKKRTVSASSMNQMVNDKEEEEKFKGQYPKVKVVATGYYAGYESTSKHPSHPQYGITYSGVKVRRDTYSTIAADLRVFPLGTVLYIPGYGYGVVADKGGAIRGNKIDLYFETKQDVYSKWGKRTVDVFIVHKGSGSLDEYTIKVLNEKGIAAMVQQKQ